MTREVGVLAMSYGTARGPEDVEAYYTHVRHGRPPSRELLADLTARYEAIGGRSPLIEITEKQVAALEAELNATGNDVRWRVYHGMKHQSPYLENAVGKMAGDGIREAIGVVLAPHYSRLSVGEYVDRVERAAAGTGVRFRFVRSYAEHPMFVAFVASMVADALAQLTDEERDRAAVVFSAHSLPARIVAEGDPYPDELRGTAEAVAKELDLDRWTTAWQSAGRTAEEWLGPDLSDVIRSLAADGVPAVVSCPVGFVADHLEVLYDVDIAAQGVAREAGVRLVRTASPNDDPAFIRMLATVVRERLERED